MNMGRFATANDHQRRLMAVAVEQFLRTGGASVELVQAGPGEWRVDWQRQRPREQLVLATIYTEREPEARAALIGAVWDSLHGAGNLDAASLTESYQ